MANAQVVHRAGWVLSAFFCCLLVLGCKTAKTGPGADSLASIDIQGHTPLEIARAVSETFKGAGYEAIPVPPSDDLRMQFEKKGGTGSALLYSDWSFQPIWYRARIKLIRTGADTVVVTCNAFRVNERGSAHFEEEHKVSGMSKGTYQDLLDQAKAKVMGTTK
jgi:hypothetical protein